MSIRKIAKARRMLLGIIYRGYHSAVGSEYVLSVFINTDLNSMPSDFARGRVSG